VKEDIFEDHVHLIPHNLISNTFCKEAIAATLKAGKLLQKGFGTNYSVYPKKEKNDVVTEFDHASEKIIVDHLRKKFPTHSFLCEEEGRLHGSSEYCWIIDPLDGTVNFSHNIPCFCISVALAKEETIICGVIFDPITKELFVAVKGEGAYINGKRMNVSQTCDLESAFGAASLSFNLHKDRKKSIDDFAKIAEYDFPMRALGSAALHLAYVASGRFDLYWNASGSTSSWDVAAGKLLVEEGGGIFTCLDGSPYRLYEQSSLLATNGKLHAPMLAAVGS